jgi:hypothetical protein
MAGRRQRQRQGAKAWPWTMTAKKENANVSNLQMANPHSQFNPFALSLTPLTTKKS